MGMYEVKTKLLTLISLANSTLSPQITHVLGNWKTNIDKLSSTSFPIITVRIMDTIEQYQYGQKTPTKTTAQYYIYRFTAFAYALTISESRQIADDIIDYLAEHNKDSVSGILDITNLSTQELYSKRGSKRYFTTLVEGQIMVEESLA